MGARLGNARCPRWNQLVFELLAPNYSRPVNVIDLGCAGGGWVKDCWDWGHVAVGIDGCNWGRVHGNCEWATIPQYLFTADIAKPFTVHEGVAVPRALRKWLAANPTGKPADKVIFLGKPWQELSPGQLAMTKGLVTVWKEVVGELVARGVELVFDPESLFEMTVTPAS
jgi:hypothetical protein